MDFEVRNEMDCRWNCLEATADLGSLIILSGAVHTRVEVRRMDSEMSGLVERPWLQLTIAY